MRFPAAVQMLLAHRLLFWFAVLEAYLAFSSASRAFMPHPEELRLAYFNLANLVIYTMFAAGVASIGWNRETTSKLVRCLTWGVAFSATMTAVDHLNLIDIPRVNERFAQSTFAGESIEQAYGPFSERTAMTVYLSLAVPLMLVMCGDPAEKRHRKLYLYSMVVASCSLLLSHNRAGPLAICLACAWFFLRNRRQMQKLLLKAILAGAVILAIAVYVFPGILHAYMHMLALSPLGPLLELGIEETMETRRMFRESDGIRLLLFRAVLRTLADNPFGAGLANVYTDDFGWYDPHSIYTATLMSAGLFAVPWAISLVIRYCSTLRDAVEIRPQQFLATGLHLGLLALMLIGVMHQVLFTNLFWLYLGVLAALSQQRALGARSPHFVAHANLPRTEAPRPASRTRQARKKTG